MATATGDSTSTDYKCKVCFENFNSIREVFRHELTHMVNGGESETGTKRPRQGGNPNNNRKRQKTKKQLAEGLLEIHDELREGLMGCPDGSELHVLCRIFQADPTYLSQVYNRIINDLRAVLENDNMAGHWEIHAFGSTITGMAFKDSDIDFYVCPQFRNFPFRQQFNRVTKNLHASHIFTDIIPIRNARVPIIKCVHISTGIRLDINMSSCFGVFNSRFISKLFAFDQRIHPLMLVLRIWAKSWGVTRVGRMTNYSLILLAIFYLQNCPNPILPPIKQFMSNVRPETCEGVNFAFNSKISNRTKNQQNIKELIGGFFRFYADFDFSQYIVCTYLGKRVSRAAFAEGKFRFPEYEKQLVMMKEQSAQLDKDEENSLWNRDIKGDALEDKSIMIVQDPFCLNNNTAKSVKGPPFILFQRQIGHGFRICEDRNNTAAQLLLRLFYEVAPEYDTPAAPPTLNKLSADGISSVNKNNKAGIFTCRLSPIENELFYVRLYLHNTVKDRAVEKADIDRCWCRSVVKFIELILTEMYKMTVIRKSDRGSTNNDYQLNGEIEAFAATWHTRKCDAKKGYAIFLKGQREFAQKAFDERKKEEKLMHCRISVGADQKDYSSVSITLTAIDPKKGQLAAFFHELTDRIRTFLKAYLEEMAKQNDKVTK